jgi:hypothetical protein
MSSEIVGGSRHESNDYFAKYSKSMTFIEIGIKKFTRSFYKAKIIPTRIPDTVIFSKFDKVPMISKKMFSN